MQISGTSSANASLLDYINSLNDSSSGKQKKGISTLLQQSSIASNPVVAGICNQASKSDIYKSTATNSNSVKKYLEMLMDGGEDSVFAKAEAEGNTDDAIVKIGSMVVSYNKMIANLAEEGGKTNRTFLNTLLSTVNKSGEALGKIGITTNKDGSLGTDYDTLCSASLEDLKAVFGSGSAFGQTLSQVINGVEESAAKTTSLVQIYSTAYSNSGSYSQYDYIKNLYDSLA